MTSNAVSTDSRTPGGAEQLTLLPSPAVNPRFQLSKDTRERGLRHVAEIRHALAERRQQAAGLSTIARSADRAA